LSKEKRERESLKQKYRDELTKECRKRGLNIYESLVKYERYLVRGYAPIEAFEYALKKELKPEMVPIKEEYPEKLEKEKYGTANLFAYGGTLLGVLSFLLLRLITVYGTLAIIILTMVLGTLAIILGIIGLKRAQPWEGRERIFCYAAIALGTLRLIGFVIFVML